MVDNLRCCSTCDLLHLSGLIFMACKSLGSHRRSKFGGASVVSPVISDLNISCNNLYLSVSFSTMSRTPSLIPDYGPWLPGSNYSLSFLSSCNSLYCSVLIYSLHLHHDCVFYCCLLTSFPSFRLESLGSHGVLGCRKSLREVLCSLLYTKVPVLTIALVHHFLSLCYPHVVLLGLLLFFVLLFHYVL